MYTYPNDAAGPFTNGAFINMSNKKPDKGFSTQHNYAFTTFESESGYEKSRLRSRRAKRTYDLTYTNVSGLVKAAIESFYNARSGGHESFIFDLDHVSESGTITVKFGSPLNITHVATSGSNLLNKVYTVSFNLKETYD